MKYDITIVGDGLYGLLISYFSSLAGLRVRLIGKKKNQHYSASFRSEAFSHQLGEASNFEIEESKNFYEKLLKESVNPFPVYTYIHSDSFLKEISKHHPFKSKQGNLTQNSAGLGYKFNAKEILAKLEEKIKATEIDWVNSDEIETNSTTSTKPNEFSNVFKPFDDSLKVVYALGPWSKHNSESIKIKKILVFNISLEDEEFTSGLHVFSDKDCFLFSENTNSGIISVNTKQYKDSINVDTDFSDISEVERKLVNQIIKENFNLKVNSFESINLRCIGYDLYSLNTNNNSNISMRNHENGKNKFYLPPMNGQGFKNAPTNCLKFLSEIFKFTELERYFREIQLSVQY
ncbi:hypothetical protein LFX15_02545 [Leptospira levettii]|uniref:hypothetical protein n=1 Tax=Leptospira levettii TaxID=2023178 RepID=UPI001EEBD747|nr:hypothetical protein [Leptospira levettii]MCG6147155.1 hypothetical protein [Leptospira levettii]